MNDLLLGAYQWLRAAHIFMMIAWMAGLLYLPRLFVHHMAAMAGGELDESLKLQERRLLKIITTPAMIGTWLFGGLMLWANWDYLILGGNGWMHAKLLLVVLLSGLHGFYAASQKRFERGERPRTEKFWRMVNEVPALFAIAIVILAVVEPF